MNVIKHLKRARVLLAAGVLLACTTAAIAQQALRVGFSMAKTGAYATASGVQSNAYELWRDVVNQKGGIVVAGQKRLIELVSYDDQSQGAKAAQIYEKLIVEDKVDLLLTPYATPLHIAIAPVLEKYQFPAIATTYGSTQLRDAGVKQMFFLQPLPDSWGRSLSKMLKEQGVKRVALGTLQNPFTLEVRKNLLADADGAFQVAFDQTYPGDIKDMSPLVAGVKAANADAIIMLSYPADSLMFVNSAREASVSAPLQLLMIGSAQPAFVEKLGANAEGYLGIGFWSRNTKNDRARAFFDAYRKKFATAPDDKDTTIAFASAEVLEQAVSRAGTDRAQLRAALAADSFDTIIGKVRFDAGNINTLLPAGFIQIQSGVNEVVYPASVATAPLKQKRP